MAKSLELIGWSESMSAGIRCTKNTSGLGCFDFYSAGWPMMDAPLVFCFNCKHAKLVNFHPDDEPILVRPLADEIW